MQIPHPIEAVIFDLDGTLVRTEPVHCEAWLQILARRGFQYDEEWFEQWIGTADRFLAQSVIDEHKLTIPPRTLQKEKEMLFHELVVNENQAFPGIEAGLQSLQAHLPLAIATNSAERDTFFVFQSTPIRTYMQAVFTADDVQELKPAPEMYLLAARHLGVRPEACLVMEDSPAGSLAARRAGMYVIGLTSSQPKSKMTTAHEWWDRPQAGMERIVNLVEQVKQRP
ncbi:MAG: HAD family phosphatase [Bacteroidota bacterium]